MTFRPRHHLLFLPCWLAAAAGAWAADTDSRRARRGADPGPLAPVPGPGQFLLGNRRPPRPPGPGQPRQPGSASDRRRHGDAHRLRLQVGVRRLCGAALRRPPAAPGGAGPADAGRRRPPAASLLRAQQDRGRVPRPGRQRGAGPGPRRPFQLRRRPRPETGSGPGPGRGWTWPPSTGTCTGCCRRRPASTIAAPSPPAAWPPPPTAMPPSCGGSWAAACNWGICSGPRRYAPSAGSCPGAVRSPVPRPWHYSLHHWVEDGPGDDGALFQCRRLRLLSLDQRRPAALRHPGPAGPGTGRRGGQRPLRRRPAPGPGSAAKCRTARPPRQTGRRSRPGLPWRRFQANGRSRPLLEAWRRRRGGE